MDNPPTILQLVSKFREETPKRKTQAQLKEEAEKAEKERLKTPEQKEADRQEWHRKYQERCEENKRIQEEQRPAREKANIKKLDEFIRKVAVTGIVTHNWEPQEGYDAQFLRNHGYEVEEKRTFGADRGDVYEVGIKRHFVIVEQDTSTDNQIITSAEAYKLGQDAREKLNIQQRTKLLNMFASNECNKFTEDEEYVTRTYTPSDMEIGLCEEESWGIPGGREFSKIIKEFEAAIPGIRFLVDLNYYAEYVVKVSIPRESTE